MAHEVQIGSFKVGAGNRPFLIAGPCVIESEQMALDTAGQLKEICRQIGMPFIYKSSYDKANRSSHASFRGPGMDEGLRILAEVRRQVGVPILTDVHTVDEIPAVAAVVDVLQTPAFLCRQTDFIQAVARAGRPVNIKKGQFLAPDDMLQNSSGVPVCEDDEIKVLDDDGNEVADGESGELVTRGLAAGLLINVTADKVVRLLPALVMSDAEGAELVAALVPLIKEFLGG